MGHSDALPRLQLHSVQTANIPFSLSVRMPLLELWHSFPFEPAIKINQYTIRWWGMISFDANLYVSLLQGSQTRIDRRDTF
jgi:hypothetical protein